MKREPRHYAVWSSTIQRGLHEFDVMVLAQAVDLHGPEDLIRQTATASSRAEARQTQLDMVRGTCELLRLQGHTVIDVMTDLADGTK